MNLEIYICNVELIRQQRLFCMYPCWPGGWELYCFFDARRSWQRGRKRASAKKTSIMWLFLCALLRAWTQPIKAQHHDESQNLQLDCAESHTRIAHKRHKIWPKKHQQNNKSSNNNKGRANQNRTTTPRYHPNHTGTCLRGAECVVPPVCKLAPLAKFMSKYPMQCVWVSIALEPFVPAKTVKPHALVVLQQFSRPLFFRSSSLLSKAVVTTCSRAPIFLKQMGPKHCSWTLSF